MDMKLWMASQTGKAKTELDWQNRNIASLQEEGRLNVGKSAIGSGIIAGGIGLSPQAPENTDATVPGTKIPKNTPLTNDNSIDPGMVNPNFSNNNNIDPGMVRPYYDFNSVLQKLGIKPSAPGTVRNSTTL
jgi:hypothetical protein